MRTRIERTEEVVDQLPLVSVLIPTYNRPRFLKRRYVVCWNKRTLI